MKHEELLQLIQTVSNSTLTEFHMEEPDLKLHLKKDAMESSACPSFEIPQTPTLISPAPAATPSSVITSPLVGTFYAAPAEDAEPFVRVGDHVTKGQTLAIVEAMKLMNEIECETDGIITEIHVENGQAVEYGQTLFSIQ